MAAALNQQRPEMDLPLISSSSVLKSFFLTATGIRNISRDAPKSTPTRR